VFRLSCGLAGFNYISRMLFITLTPLAIILLFVIMATVRVVSIAWERRSGRMGEVTTGLGHVWLEEISKVTPITVTVFNFAYFAVAVSLLRFFWCDGDFEDGASYLFADYSLSCQSQEYFYLWGYAVAMMLIYVIGVPVYFSSLLWSHRTLLAPFSVRQKGKPELVVSNISGAQQQHGKTVGNPLIEVPVNRRDRLHTIQLVEEWAISAAVAAELESRRMTFSVNLAESHPHLEQHQQQLGGSNSLTPTMSEAHNRRQTFLELASPPPKEKPRLNRTLSKQMLTTSTPCMLGVLRGLQVVEDRAEQLWRWIKNCLAAVIDRLRSCYTGAAGDNPGLAFRKGRTASFGWPAGGPGDEDELEGVVHVAVRKWLQGAINYNDLAEVLARRPATKTPMLSRISPLYAKYCPRFWWWEAGLLILRFLLAAVVITPAPWQLLVACAVTCLYLACLLSYRPYFVSSNNEYAILCAACLLVLYLWTAFSQLHTEGLFDEYRTWTGAIFILLLIAPLLAFIVYAVIATRPDASGERFRHHLFQEPWNFDELRRRVSNVDPVVAEDAMDEEESPTQSQADEDDLSLASDDSDDPYKGMPMEPEPELPQRMMVRDPKHPLEDRRFAGDGQFTPTLAMSEASPSYLYHLQRSSTVSLQQRLSVPSRTPVPRRSQSVGALRRGISYMANLGEDIDTDDEGGSVAQRPSLRKLRTRLRMRYTQILGTRRLRRSRTGGTTPTTVTPPLTPTLKGIAERRSSVATSTTTGTSEARRSEGYQEGP